MGIHVLFIWVMDRTEGSTNSVHTRPFDLSRISVTIISEVMVSDIGSFTSPKDKYLQPYFLTYENY